MLIAIGQAAAILGISKKSLRILDRKGIIPAVRTHGGHRRFDRKGISEFYERGEYIVEKTTSTGIAAVYGRVSTHRQKEDLGRQVKFLSDSARNDGFTPKIYKDIGSGLNDKRKGIRKLIRDALTGKFDRVYVTYLDRMARFGTRIMLDVLESMCFED